MNHIIAHYPDKDETCESTHHSRRQAVVLANKEFLATSSHLNPVQHRARPNRRQQESQEATQKTEANRV